MTLNQMTSREKVLSNRITKIEHELHELIVERMRLRKEMERCPSEDKPVWEHMTTESGHTCIEII